MSNVISMQEAREKMDLEDLHESISARFNLDVEKLGEYDMYELAANNDKLAQNKSIQGRLLYAAGMLHFSLHCSLFVKKITRYIDLDHKQLDFLDRELSELSVRYMKGER